MRTRYVLTYRLASTHTDTDHSDLFLTFTNKQNAIDFIQTSVEYELFEQGPSTEFYDYLLHPGDQVDVVNTKTEEIVYSKTY
jgi:hypothetical protein